MSILLQDNNSEDSFGSDYSDIESYRFSSITVSSVNTNDQRLISILKPSDENDRQTQEILEYCVNISTIFTILLINVPLVILDIYNALKNYNCIYSYNKGYINIFIYLCVSGIKSGVETIVMLSLIYLNMYKLIELKKSIVYITLLIRTIVGLSWTIVGSFVVFNFIKDKHYCHNELYIYVLVQLIIKYIVVLFNSRGLLEKKIW